MVPRLGAYRLGSLNGNCAVMAAYEAFNAP